MLTGLSTHALGYDRVFFIIMSKILYISSEAFPLIKTGGLGDVAGSLPIELLKKSQDIRLLLPAYPEVLEKITQYKVRAEISYYNLSVKIIETKLPGSKLTVWLVDCPAAFNRPGGPYSNEHGQEWHDNALRFAIFCHVATDISLNRLPLNWQADIVHCNDWQCGLVPALLSLHTERPKTVFTIHNLAYQGVFNYQTFFDLKLPEKLWHIEGVEYYGNMSFIKSGIAYADEITTVSPSYAKEICSPKFGYGLDGLLTHRKNNLTGILNGIDNKCWNPATDKHIKQTYNLRSINKKQINKTELQQELSLKIDVSLPMIGMVSRLVEQKGLEIILQSLPRLLKSPLQFVILGTGETHYEMLLTEWAKEYKDRFKVVIGYDESLAHRIEAASDMYLMPSTFEPCGLNQLYSLRYGTLPIVNPVGGLADTVIDFETKANNLNLATGFVLKEQTTSELSRTVLRAIELHKHKNSWKQLQINAMESDFSWHVSAQRYIELYEMMLEKPDILPVEKSINIKKKKTRMNANKRK